MRDGRAVRSRPGAIGGGSPPLGADAIVQEVERGPTEIDAVLHGSVRNAELGLPPALRPRRRRLTERVPALFPVAVEILRLRRRLQWLRWDVTWACDKDAEALPHRVIKHKSLLLRTLGASQMWLQHNKVVNLRIAAERLDGLLIRPGEEFSFCRTVGKATRRRGCDRLGAEVVKTNCALVRYVPEAAQATD